MASLFDLNAEIQEFVDLVEAGEIPEEAIKDTLDMMQLTFDARVDGLATYVKILSAEAEDIESEKKALDERIKAKKHKCAGIKQYIFEAMQQAGKRKIETPKNVITVSGCKKSVKIDNELDFLAHYPDYKAEEKPVLPKVDKNAVYKALSEGKELAGASLAGGQTLRIG